MFDCFDSRCFGLRDRVAQTGSLHLLPYLRYSVRTYRTMDDRNVLVALSRIICLCIYLVVRATVIDAPTILTILRMFLL